MALYTGIALPNSTNKYPSLQEDVVLIRNSIETILLTKLGQRFMVPDFGSNLWKLVFEPNDSGTARLAEQIIGNAIRIWEQRVILQGVAVNIEEHVLHIEVSVIVKRLNLSITIPLDISRERLPRNF